MNKTVSRLDVPVYRPYTLKSLRDIPQIERLSKQELADIEIVGRVLPFRTNNYVVDELINWDNVPDDPIFRLTFPSRDMLRPHHYARMEAALKRGDNAEIEKVAHEIRLDLNPHPAGQMTENVPTIGEEALPGMQHKYDETVLFFPSQGQTCHAYCSFCFRWPQFVGEDEFKFAAREVGALVDYLKEHDEVTDVLFTGGDPLIMKARLLSSYIDPLLEADLPNLKTIRIGSKSLSFWPYKFLTDRDAEGTLAIFERIAAAGKHPAFMAHVNHPNELQTEALEQAVERIRATGAQIRTQAPIMNNINNSADVWARMWRRQVDLGMIPYYMFMARDTGAQHYFGVPMEDAWKVFRDAYQQVSGICRTARGPVMSAHPGKVQILGVSEVGDEKVYTLRFIQGRNSDWAQRPFFARYDPDAIWLDDLKPAFGEDRFFFEEEFEPGRVMLQVA